MNDKTVKPVRIYGDPEKYDIEFDEEGTDPCADCAVLDDPGECDLAPCTAAFRKEYKGVHYVQKIGGVNDAR
ncbi:MAG: hypothetical protein WCS18_11445 [Sphaerochaetaceae bacterium]